MAEQIRMSSAELAIRLLTGGESLKSREEAERLLAEIRQSTRAEVLREAADRFDRENDDNEILRGDYPGAALRDWAASSSPSPAAGDKQPETEVLCRCGHLACTSARRCADGSINGCTCKGGA